MALFNSFFNNIKPSFFIDTHNESRKHRPLPLRDENILGAWNGLMISGYVQAGLLLNNPVYVERAIKAAHFIWEKLFIKGRLFRSYKDGIAKHNGYLSDYAFVTASLLDLYDATFDPGWLKKAIHLDSVLESFYEDKEKGGFFMTSHDHEELLAREKSSSDGAELTGNSFSLLNLLRLNKFMAKDSYRKRATKSLRAFSGTLVSRPAALSEVLLAADFYFDRTKEIIIVIPEGEEKNSNSFLEAFRKVFLPSRILSVVSEGDDLKNQAKVIPLVFKKKNKTRKSYSLCL